MKLKIDILEIPKHSELCSCVCWTNSDEVYSCSDDHQVLKWVASSKISTLVVKLSEDIFPIDIKVVPRAISNKISSNANDIMALSSTDGKLLFISRAGRVEKSIDAHFGAILALKWNHNGTDLITAGEDGNVKIWSRSGMLRSTLSQTSNPIYSATWNPESDSVLFSSSKNLIIKPIQPNAKQKIWKAHDGLILCVDWNISNNLILSGGEDCKYKIWDCHGSQLFGSQLQDYPINTLAWCPDANLFVVGSFNTLKLCDKIGWCHSLEKLDTGSIINISWSADSTQLSAACGNGHVLFGHVIERKLEWKNFEVILTGSRSINVLNVSNDARDNLEFREPVIKISISYNYLIVITSTRCYIYSVNNWNTPIDFELKEGNVNLIMQAYKLFLLIDGSILYVYSYEGRFISSPKSLNIRFDLCTHSTLTISDDVIAVRDKLDEKVIYLIDPMSGKLLGDGKPIIHKMEVMEILLDNFSNSNDRRLALVDKNRDLYLWQVRVIGTNRLCVKLEIVVDDIKWNTESSSLVALAAGKLFIWVYPNVVFVDKDLLSRTIIEKDASEFGKNSQLISFTGSHVILRKCDGSLVTCSVSLYPVILQNHVNSNRWQDAVRICRFAKNEMLWACLAAMSANNKNLDTALLAYAALEEPEKIKLIKSASEEPCKEVRLAEMALLCGQALEAEAIYLQAGKIFRAIWLNLTIFNFERALELSVKHKSHVDTVLAMRDRYIKSLNRHESNKKFIQYSQGLKYDWANIEAKIEAEFLKEGSKINL